MRRCSTFVPRTVQSMHVNICAYMRELNMKKKAGRRTLSTVYLDPKHKSALDRLSKRTRVPKAAYLREGAELVLRKYKITRGGARQ